MKVFDMMLNAVAVGFCVAVIIYIVRRWNK